VTDQQEQGPVIRTIARGLAILNAFDETKPELGVTELSQLTDLDKATVYRLLSALQQGGLIEQDRATSKYRLGFGLVQLAGLVLRRLDLPQIVRPHLQELAQHSQETVNLSVMTDDDKLINIDRVASPRRIRNVGWIGRQMPLHAVSGGKVVMAYLSQDRLDRILSSGLESFTERGAGSRAQRSRSAHLES
jgi:IclR family KDG regulon transcriptional repressor